MEDVMIWHTNHAFDVDFFFFFYEILTKLKSALSSPTESGFSHLWSITEQLFNFLNSESDTDIISGILLAAPSLGT